MTEVTNRTPWLYPCRSVLSLSSDILNTSGLEKLSSENTEKAADETYRSGMVYGYMDGDRTSLNDTRIHCNTVSKCPWLYLLMQGSYNEVLTCQSYFIVLYKENKWDIGDKLLRHQLVLTWD